MEKIKAFFKRLFKRNPNFIKIEITGNAEGAIAAIEQIDKSLRKIASIMEKQSEPVFLNFDGTPIVNSDILGGVKVDLASREE